MNAKMNALHVVCRSLASVFVASHLWLLCGLTVVLAAICIFDMSLRHKVQSRTYHHHMAPPTLTHFDHVLAESSTPSNLPW